MSSSNEDCPAIDLKSISASNSVADPSGPFRSLYVGGTGDIKVTTIKGTDITLTAVAGGMFHPIGCSRVWVTGTTATSILGVPSNDHTFS